MVASELHLVPSLDYFGGHFLVFTSDSCWHSVPYLSKCHSDRRVAQNILSSSRGAVFYTTRLFIMSVLTVCVHVYTWKVECSVEQTDQRIKAVPECICVSDYFLYISPLLDIVCHILQEVIL